MTEFAARISRVTMKAGGADIRVLPNSTPRTDLGPRMLAAARRGSEAGNIVAYAVIGLYDNGYMFTGTATDFGDGLMNRFAFVGMVNEAVRDNLINEETACEVFNRGMGFD